MIVFLHVGAPKTGTTYLQEILRQNRVQLAAEGFCYPGAGTDHFRAAQDLLGWRFGEDGSVDDGRWRRLVDDLRSSGADRGLISHEILGRAGPAEVERAMADLDFAEVHLVYSTRDLGRMIPAMWQEKVKNREQTPYDVFLRNLRQQYERHRDDGEQFARHLRGFDLAGTLRTWGRGLPAERVHIVTTPVSGPPEDLWARFAQVLGLEPGRYTAEVPRNPSLGPAEAEFLRRLNGALEDTAVTWQQYHRVVKHHLAQQVLAARPGVARILLPAADREWVASWSAERTSLITSAGYDVVGDVDDLVPPPAPAEDPQPPTEREVADAGAMTAASLVERLAQRPPRAVRPAPPAPAAPLSRVRAALARRVARRPALARAWQGVRRVRSRIRLRSR